MRNFVVFAGLAVVLAGCSGTEPAAPASAWPFSGTAPVFVTAFDRD